MVVFAVILASVPLVSGCGGSGQAAPLKKPQFIQQADAICRHAESELETAIGEATKKGAGEMGQADLVTEVALPSMQNMTEELADLGVPVGDEKEVQRIIHAFDRGIATLEKNPTSVTADIGAFHQATDAADEYGLTDCGI